jgi:Rieske Fe-S protein
MKVFSRRNLSLGFLIGIFNFVAPSFASSKPPIICKFKGQTVTYNGNVFTCIQVKVKGKRVLTWDNGVKIQISQSSPSNSPSPAPTQIVKTEAPPVVNRVEIAIAKSSEVNLGEIKAFAGTNRFGNVNTYLVARKSNGLLVMSAVCTHSGCTIQIQNEGLVCPCHNALFDPDSGEVLRGPASYPLDRLPVRENNGTIYITD